MTTPSRIEVLAGPDELADVVARRLLEVLADAQAEGRVPQIALTGGTIADVLHRRIAELSPDSGVDWSRVAVWWGDERFVAPDSEDRNALQARRAFLDLVGVDESLVHEMPSTVDAASTEAGAEAYSATLRAHGAGEFDVLMLGVGPDGHCASLFPGHPALKVDNRVATYVTDSPKPPPERITLTFSALNRSRVVWFLASGEGKADAVARALAPAPDSNEEAAALLSATPARGVHGREATVWWLDRAAASLL